MSATERPDWRFRSFATHAEAIAWADQEPAPILCRCGHDIDFHDWDGGCTDCEATNPCSDPPSDIAREYARQCVANELRVAAVVARDTRWNARHVDEQRVTRDAEGADL